MTDDELIRAFESAELPGDRFTHETHVRVAWTYLSRHPFAEALGKFDTALRRFADAKGASGKYHATITIAYLLLIAERLDATPGLDWPAFAAGNPDLLSQRPSILERYYTNDVLHSERARRVFVMPDAR